MGGHRPKRQRGEDVTENFFRNNAETGSYLNLALTEGKSLKSRGWPWVQTGLRNILDKGKVDKATFLRDGSLLLKTKDVLQTEKLLSTDRFMNEACKVSRNEKMNSSKGTIHAFDLLDLTEEEIVHWLKEFGVTGAKRFTRWVGGRTEPTPTVLLTFNVPSCPDRIQLDYITYHVKKHIPNPLLCFNCGQYGHPESRCTNKKRCLDCGGEEHHDEGGCARKCLSCGDTGHTCRSRDCPRWQKEKEICKLKVEHEISYAEARKQYETSHQPPLLHPYSEVVRVPTPTGKKESELRDKVDKLEGKIGKLEEKIDEMTTFLTQMAQQMKLSVAVPQPSVSHTCSSVAMDKQSGDKELNCGTSGSTSKPVPVKATVTTTKGIQNKKTGGAKPRKGKVTDAKTVDVSVDMINGDEVHEDFDTQSQIVSVRSRSLDRGPRPAQTQRRSWIDASNS